MVLSKILLSLLLHRVIKNRRRSRCQYIRPLFMQRSSHGESFLVKELRLDPHYHHAYFRMRQDSFDELFSRVKPHLMTTKNHAFPINEIDKFAITMRYLASGNSQISLGLSFRISPATISRILRQTLFAICTALESDCLSVPTVQNWETIANQFEKRWNFPHCCGSIDGKHIRVKAPGNSGTTFYNYKNFYSVVLLAIVDANYQFIFVDIGQSGSASDGGILSRSPIGRIIEDGPLPAAKPLSNGQVFPYVFVGDDAFALKLHLMRPYAGKYLQKEDNIFNYRLSRARLVVENAFGILAARWRIFHSCIDAKLDLVKLIIQCAVLLHNFLGRRHDLNNLTFDGDDGVPGNWRNSIGQVGLEDAPFIDAFEQECSDAFVNRENLKQYFLSNDGKISWQENHVMQGYE